MKTLNDVIKQAGIRELSENELTEVSGGREPFTDNQGNGCDGSGGGFCQAFDESFAQG